MQKFLLHIVLLSYTVIMVKPVLPYIADFAAHTFSYSQHVATVHYEDGKFHVHNKVVDESSKTQKQSESPATKKDNATADHTNTEYKEITGPFFNPSAHFPYSIVLIPHNYLQGDFQPPRL